MKLTGATQFSVVNGTLMTVLTLTAYFGIFDFEMILPHHWHKMLHLLGVVLFMGNMIAGPFWFLYAYYSKDKGLLKFANHLLQLTDMYLTIPGVALTVINGLFLASIYGGIKEMPFLFNSMLLLLLMWAMSIPLIYYQEKMYTTIENEPENETKLNSILIKWSILGTIVMIPPSIVFYLMVTKGA